MPVTVRPATEADLPALTRLDLTYPTDRYLALERSGEPPEHTFTLRWRNRVPRADGSLRHVHCGWIARGARTDGPLPRRRSGRRGRRPADDHRARPWTDAAEITDLAVDIAFRRMGAGRALVDAAVEWARKRDHRSLWVEPRADNHAAISFYVSLGFRVSGFNDRMYSNARP